MNSQYEVTLSGSESLSSLTHFQLGDAFLKWKINIDTKKQGLKLNRVEKIDYFCLELPAQLNLGFYLHELVLSPCKNSSRHAWQGGAKFGLLLKNKWCYF